MLYFGCDAVRMAFGDARVDAIIVGRGCSFQQREAGSRGHHIVQRHIVGGTEHPPSISMVLVQLCAHHSVGIPNDNANGREISAAQHAWERMIVAL